MPGAVLPKVDRMSMQHALEVRTPFLNTELARFAERVPPEMLYQAGRGKILLRELACRYLPREWIDAPKQGFGIPMTQWGREELLGAAGQLLESEDSRLRNAFGSAAIDRFMARQRSPGGFATYQVWALSMLESWCRNHPAKLPDFAAEYRRCAVGSKSAVIEQPVDAPEPDRLQRFGRHLAERHPLAARLVKSRPARGVYAVYFLLKSKLANSSAIRLFQPMPMRQPPWSRQEQPALFAWTLGQGVFAVFEQGELEGPGAAQGQAGSLSQNRLRQLGFRYCLAGQSIDADFSLAEGNPGFALPVLDSVPTSTSAASLRGAVVFLPGDRLVEWLSWATVEYFRRLGVAKLVFAAPADPRPLLQVCLRSKPAWKEWADIAKLRLLSIQAGGGLGWPLLVSPRKGWQFVSHPLESLPALPDNELSLRYLAFESFRQLPPVLATHDSIERLGDGRYALSSGHCLFAQSTGKRLPVRDYWLAENNPGTRELLPAYPECLEPPLETADFSAYAQKLAVLCASQPASEEASLLRPGDPVVVLTHALPPGGAERQWCYLAIGLKHRGFKVSFLVTESLAGDNSHYLAMLKDHGIDAAEVEAFCSVAAAADLSACPLAHPAQSPFGLKLTALTAALRQIKPKTVFAQLDFPNLMAGIAGHVAGVPRIVLSFRNYNPSHFLYLDRDWLLPMYRALCASPRIRLSGNATAANADYARWLGIPPERVAFIPNAIDGVLFPHPANADLEALREELGLVAGAPVVLGVFRLSEEKEPLVFLAVCARLARLNPGLRVLLVGIGPMQAQVEAAVESLGLAGSIQLLGKRDDVPALVSIASLLLSVSSFEGMSNAILEAQLMGLPVVCTATGASADIVAHGESGYVCPVGDVEALAAACGAILSMTDASPMRDAARRRIVEGFSLDLLTERHIRLVNDKGIGL
jgi:glycosyltransferase involved in cell wall biosynthesis